MQVDNSGKNEKPMKMKKKKKKMKKVFDIGKWILVFSFAF